MEQAARQLKTLEIYGGWILTFSSLYCLFDLSTIYLLKVKAAAFTVVAGLRFCLVAHGLPDRGGPAEPTEATADWAERQRPRAQIQASCCSWILLRRRLAIKTKTKENITKKMMVFINQDCQHLTLKQRPQQLYLLQTLIVSVLQNYLKLFRQLPSSVKIQSLM